MVNLYSPEYQALKELNEVVTGDIRADIISFAQALQRRDLISLADVELATKATGLSNRHKAAILLDHVFDKIKVDTKLFYTFCECLDELQYNKTAKMLRDKCKELATAPCT